MVQTPYTPSPHTYAPHAQPISFFSILSPAQYWVRSTNHLAPRYAVSSIPPLPRPSYVQIFSSTPCSQTPSAFFPPAMSTTKFHTDTKQQAKLWFIFNIILRNWYWFRISPSALMSPISDNCAFFIIVTKGIEGYKLRSPLCNIFWFLSSFLGGGRRADVSHVMSRGHLWTEWLGALHGFILILGFTRHSVHVYCNTVACLLIHCRSGNAAERSVCIVEMHGSVTSIKILRLV